MTEKNKGPLVHRVVVESAAPLTEAQIKKLKQKITKVLGTSDYDFAVRHNKDILGGLILTVDSVVIDASLRGQMRAFKEQLDGQDLKDKTLTDIQGLFQKQVEDFVPTPVLKEVGKVLSVKDGIATLSGLHHVEMGEEVLFESGAKGLILGLNQETVAAAVLTETESIQEGTDAYRTKQKISVPVGKDLLGRVVNALGMPVDGKKNLGNLPKKPIYAEAPPIITRDAVNRPIQTGIKGIDALVPIGKGQRELIIGDRQTGKTALILDMILSQKTINEAATKPEDKVFCVYVAIGQKQSSVRDFVEVLKKRGALEYTIVVSATAAESSGMQYLAPYAGCTMAEYFRDNGLNAIVFYDDLSKHAVAYRELSLLLKRPPGREAYPGDIFYIHSRLLERAAQLDKKLGGGSLTAIPVIETQEGDVSAYIPTNVISITDGQIFLETNLFHQGVRPAINVGLSVSRVGSAAQTKAMKKVSGSLKLDLAQYREMLIFSQFASDLDKTTQRMLHQGARLTQILKQDQYSPMTFGQEVVSLFAGVNGYLDEVRLEDVEKYEKNLQEHLKTDGRRILDKLEAEPVLTEDMHKRLTEFVGNFTRDFIENAQYDKPTTD